MPVTAAAAVMMTARASHPSQVMSVLSSDLQPVHVAERARLFRFGGGMRMNAELAEVREVFFSATPRALPFVS